MSAHKIVVSVVCNRRGGCRWRCTHLLRRARRSTGPTAASGACGSRLDQEDVFTAFERAQTTLAFGF
jgi:hypothetical protein